MTISAGQNKQALKFSPGNATALGLTGLFLVVSVTFVLHFNLIYAPFQGAELEPYLLAQSSGAPDTIFSGDDLLAGPALPRLLLVGVWHLSAGAIVVIRALALLLHVLAAALSFLLIQLWLGRRDSVILPLLGSLLVAVSPASVAVISQVRGWPILWAINLLLLAGLLYLAGTRNLSRHLYGRIALCCWCVAAAAAAYPVLVLGSLAILLMDWLRVGEKHSRFLSGDRRSPLMVLACGVSVFLVLYVSDMDLTVDAASLLYLATVVSAFCVCRVAESLSGVFVKRAVAVLLAVLLAAGAVISFWLTLACVDPAAAMEKQAAMTDKALIRKRLAMQYYEKALRQNAPEERRLLAGQSAEAWTGIEDGAPASASENLLRARALMDSGNAAEAAKAASQILEAAPFGNAGVAASRLRASALETGQAKETADLFSFASRKGEMLSFEDGLHRARALVSLGDIESAREILAYLPEIPKDSPEGIFQRGVVEASNGARTLQESYRRKISQDPQDISAYVDLAKGSLLSGNSLRAFYFLEMALRREPGNQEAWEYLGMVFAREAQPAYFIDKWGAGKPDKSRAWFSLAGRAAGAGFWDAAFEYAGRFAGSGVPSAEEYVAVFAIEAKQPEMAEQWISRAIEAHPESFSPRLLQADLALARGTPDQARAFLEEAKRLQAPEVELQKRMERLQGGQEPVPAPGEPFQPVRTYIQ